MPVGARQTLRFGPFELDPHCGQLRKDGLALKLQGQPIQILEILLENNGELVTRDELRQRLWASDTFVDFDHSLNTAIKKLRQALGDEADKPRFIETVPKRGYRFIGAVDHEDSQAESRTSEQSATEDRTERIATALADAAIEASAATKKSRRHVRFVTFALLLVVASGAIYWATKPPPMPRIVASRALTKTGFRKTWAENRLVSDGVLLYFQEARPAGVTTMHVPIRGGEPSKLPIAAGETGSLRDISKDGSELLLSIFDPSAQRYDAWIQALPNGPARLLVKNARWATWSAEGRSIFFVRNGDHELWRVNVDGTDERRLVEFPDVTGLAVSPDGRRIRVGVKPTSALWEAGADGSNPHPIFTEHKDRIAMGDWSSDGKYFFFLSSDGDNFNLWVTSDQRHWWAGSRPTARQLTFEPRSIVLPIPSKDGKRIYAVGREPHGELSILDPSSGKFVPYLSGISACYMDFSRDGQWVAYVSYPEGTLWRSRIDGSERRQLTVPPLAVMNPRWSPDGKLVAFGEVSGGDRRHPNSKSRIYAVSTEGGVPMLLLAGDQSVSDPTWSRDGTAMAYEIRTGASAQSSEIRILDLRTQLSTKVPGSDGFWSPRWSPDGKYLVALGGSYPSKTVLFSSATQQWRELSAGNFNWPNWSPDSKFVYALRGAGSLVRIRVSDGRTEQVASVQGFPAVAYLVSGWFGLSPDGRPITTRDTGLEEIYAFDLEYK